METAGLINYIKTTENNVVPLKVASGIQGVSFFSKLPRSFQDVIVKRSGKSNPYMSFVVEPYSTFLAFEIVDFAVAERLLPSGYTLLPSSLFGNGKERPCAIIGAINVHTSLFWGSRLEFYLIAENKQTGLLSWIIATYETNTSSYDPNRGFIGATTEHCVITTSYRGEVIVDVKSAQTSDHMSYVADISHARPASMNERLWIEGNLSVDYGGDLQKSSDPFGLIFDPKEVQQGLMIAPEDVTISLNTYGQDFLDPKPFEAAYFPYAQHFMTTSFPVATPLTNADDLEREVAKLSESFPVLW
ncbi:MAG: hypothetical protein RR547_03135 [Raoultibacter sp.]